MNRTHHLLLGLFSLLILACACGQPETGPADRQNNSVTQTHEIELISPQPVQIESSPTPDPCTGWTCDINGMIVFEDSVQNSGIAEIPVKLNQISWCSPTKGEQQTVTDADGHFIFTVFLHDTDSFVISAEADGFHAIEKKFGGFDCLFCHCPPFELVLASE